MKKSNALVDRIATAVGEQRPDTGISMSELSRLSGVSRSTIRKLERGGRIDPALVVRLALTLTVLELYRPPAPTLDEEMFDEVITAFERPKPLGDVDRNGDLIGGAA
jgi:transcriptional regulator with XRE-family HTH domain